MIKYICDICKKEFEPEERGEFKSTEKVIGFLKHQKQLNMREMSWLFCVSCSRELREKVTELARKKGLEALK